MGDRARTVPEHSAFSTQHSAFSIQFQHLAFSRLGVGKRETHVQARILNAENIEGDKRSSFFARLTRILARGMAVVDVTLDIRSLRYQKNSSMLEAELDAPGSWEMPSPSRISRSVLSCW